MTTAMLESNSKKNLERIGKEMPILIMAGGQDPVGDFGKEPKRLYKKYKSLDLDCRIRIYKESRHELVNDVDKEQVFKDLLKWLDYYTK